jgi:hypothetical protein
MGNPMRGNGTRFAHLECRADPVQRPSQTGRRPANAERDAGDEPSIGTAKPLLSDAERSALYMTKAHFMGWVLLQQRDLLFQSLRRQDGSFSEGSGDRR